MSLCVVLLKFIQRCSLLGDLVFCCREVAVESSADLVDQFCWDFFVELLGVFAYLGPFCFC